MVEWSQGDNLDDAVLSVEASLIASGITKGRTEGEIKARTLGLQAGILKGRELGIELGFYRGTLRALRALEKRIDRSKDGPTSHLDKPGEGGTSRRVSEINQVQERVARPNVVQLINTLEILVDELLQSFETFDDSTYNKMVRIRAKYKVLESRLGLVLDITPELGTLQAGKAASSGGASREASERTGVAGQSLQSLSF